MPLSFQYAVEQRPFTIPSYTTGSATTKYGFQIKPISNNLGAWGINTAANQGWVGISQGKYQAASITGVIGVPDAAAAFSGYGALGTSTGGSPNDQLYAWPSIIMYFTIDGNGSLPTPSFGATTRTIVPLKTGDTTMQISHKIAAAVMGSFVYDYTCTSVPVPTTSVAEYIEVSSDTTSYYIWFEVAGVGTDPAIAGKTGKKITLTALDTPTTTAAAIAQTMNSLTFSTPTIASATTGFSNFILI